MSQHITRWEWNRFLIGQEHAEFLQSWEWGESAYTRDRADILRVAFPEEGPLRACMQLIQGGEGTPFRYWYAPGGPVALSREDTEYVLDAAVAELHGRFAPFLRIEPSNALVDTQRMKKVKDGRPVTTRVINLTAGIETVFNSMHEKTRYNIRLSAKKGVQVREIFYNDTDREDIMKCFHSILRATARRDGFSLHPWLHYVHLVDAFLRKKRDIPLRPDVPTLRFTIASYENTVIAVALSMAFGDTITYLHGGSSGEHRSVMAPYALQWHAIREAIEDGYRWYDLWGVAPALASQDHPWTGITRFKQGFGGKVIEYPGTFDIPLRPIQYRMYSAARAVNQFLRRPIR